MATSQNTLYVVNNRKNTRKQSPRSRVRTSRPVYDVAAIEKQLRAMNDAFARRNLNRVLEAFAASGEDEDIRKAVEAMLSEDPLSDTTHAFLDELHSHLPDHGLNPRGTGQ
jgi:hypothetical protein